MPINQPNKDKPVFCISCGKMICKGHIESGSIEIRCKCGVKNRIEANKPEGRENISTDRAGRGYLLIDRKVMERI